MPRSKRLDMVWVCVLLAVLTSQTACVSSRFSPLRAAVDVLRGPRASVATADAAAPGPQPPPVERIRVRLMAGEKHLTLYGKESIQVSHGAGSGVLPPGTWRISASQAIAARQRFHVFAKTFKPDEGAASQAYLREWSAKGHQPELLTFGRQFRTKSGALLDNRVFWVSLARFDAEAEAVALKAKLEKENVWAWVRPETVAAGEGTLRVSDPSGKTIRTGPAPMRFRSSAVIGVSDVDSGFWRERRENRYYGGELEIGIGPGGLLEIYESLPLDDYLRGVLPAEMPASWPIEALKAQAVTARSSVVADLAGKHHLEGFDCCGTEHCRAYEGRGAWQESTNRAVTETAGEVLAAGGRVAPTVFSSDCGGWTENNDTVWAAPADPVLRGVADFPSPRKAAARSPDQTGIDQWVRSKPPAFCSVDKDSFRWTRRFTAEELTRLVNERHAVGPVRAVEPGARGVSGRLKSVRIVGGKDAVTVQKDLPIRLAFGGLPSALFIVVRETDGKGRTVFTFVGGGRGHGVGLCQHGARGMALAGATCKEIVKQYFTGIELAAIEYP